MELPKVISVSEALEIAKGSPRQLCVKREQADRQEYDRFRAEAVRHAVYNLIRAYEDAYIQYPKNNGYLFTFYIEKTHYTDEATTPFWEAIEQNGHTPYFVPDLDQDLHQTASGH